jgi:hypothetical protein
MKSTAARSSGLFLISCPDILSCFAPLYKKFVGSRLGVDDSAPAAAATKPILTAEESSAALPPSASMLTRVAVSAFGWNRPPRSCGSMGSNSGHRGVSAGLDHRNRHPCSEWQWRLSSFCT